MKKKILKRILAGTFALALTATSVPFSTQAAKSEKKEKAENDLRLWYTQPASKGKNILSAGSFGTTEEDNTWQQQTLPIGNSFMGANVYGEIGKERLTFNQKTLWNGGPSDKRPDYNGGNKETAANGEKMSDLYKRIIELYKEGKDSEANSLSSQLVGLSDGYGAYQSWGDIYVDFGFEEDKAKDYVRDLNLENAISSVDFDYNGTKMHREYFVSYPDNVLAMKFTAEGSEKLNFDISFPIDNAENVDSKGLGKDVTTTAKDDTITVAGEMQDNQMKLNGQMKVVASDGQVDEKDKETLQVKNASEVVVYVSADTDYKNEYPSYRTGETAEELAKSVADTIDAAVEKGYADVKKDHIADHSNIFDRVDLDLGQVVPDKATDVLLADYKNGSNSDAENRALEVLLFQYGRYLTIASSRDGDLPANLQGVWQNRVGDANRVPWGSDYHMNVNLQMNYWPTYVTNMAECATPLVDYVYSLMEPGKVTAQTYFGVENGGFTAHTQNTPFGWTCPGWDFSWGWSPAALPWILQNCWEYYEYTGDVDYMRENIYPMLKESALLYDQIMIEDEETGRLVSAPAYSPEHGPITAGNTYEQSLIWQLYEDAATAAEILGVDADKVQLWRERQAKLMPIEIGDSGQIKEWYTETTLGSMGQAGHRHMSHLLGLFPGDLISVDNSEYMEAAIVSLKERGDTSTGWGMGQRINAWARTGDGNQAHKLIQNLFRDGIYPNLWDSHAPFQIDGNFGMTSGVAEMLMQSNMGYINMLAALPDAWADGSVDGLIARGNFEVSMKWEDKQITESRILSNNGGKVTVQADNLALGTVVDEDGNVLDIEAVSADRISFDTEAGKTYTLQNIPKEEVVEVPTGLTAKRLYDDKVKLEWNAVEAEGVTYNVYRQVENGDVQEIESDLAETVYEDTTASDALGNIQYQVSAVVNKKESEKSEKAAVKDMRNMAGMIDDRDSRIAYTGAWGDWDEDVNYAGTIKYLQSPTGGETAALDFVGTGIEVIVCTNYDRGYYNIYIDGELVAENVDTYSANTVRQAKVFSKDDLAYGEHTIVVEATGTHNPDSKGAKVELDAFHVLDNTIVKPESVKVSTVSGITTIGQADSKVQMKAEVLPEDAKDKSVTWSSSDSSIATVDENGLVTVGSQNGTVTITATSNADATKSGSMELKVAIAGDVQDAETIVEDAVNDGSWKLNPDITWSDGWSTWAGEPDKHHGTTKTEAQAGAWFEYTFTGTGIEVYVQKHANFANFDIEIDGEKIGTYSFEGSSSGDPQSLLFDKKDLDNGEHTIKCTITARDGKTQANLDYLKVFKPAEAATVDKAALQAAITAASSLEETAYDEAKWSAFKTVYKEAVAVMNDDDATEDEVNNALQNLEAAVKALGDAQPPKVEKEEASVIFVESTSALVQWDAVRGASSYKVIYGEKEVTTGNTYVKLTDLAPATTYELKIYAVNEGGSSQKAIEVILTTTVAEGNVTVPQVTDVQKTAVSDTSVKLSWKAPTETEIAEYQIYVNGKHVGTTEKTEYMMEELEEGQTYVVKIVACDKEGNQSLPVQFSFIFQKEKKQVIAGVAALDGITVENGVAFKDLPLPKTVSVTLETTRLNEELNVNWEKGDYDKDKAGTYVLEGTLELKNGITNPDNVKATIEVTVKEKEETKEPGNPGNPGTPSTPDNGNGQKPSGGNQSGSNTVKTGDSSFAWGWGVIAAAAVSVTSVIIARRKRSK